jgi:hypothetical protein
VRRGAFAPWRLKPLSSQGRGWGGVGNDCQVNEDPSP